ncbi:MAG TPA: sugar transferase, partial [Actinomycetota bacterium]|nr:sugar transferase [Actinomycetota bacterium]
MKTHTWTKVLRLPDADKDEPQVVRRPFPVPSSTLSETKRSYVGLYAWMALTDALAVAAGLNLADFLLAGFSIAGPGQWGVSLLGMVITLAVFAALRLYSAHQLAPAEEFRRIILAVTVTITTVFTLSLWVDTSQSRLWILLSWGIAAVLALGSRRLWHYYVYRQRVRGRLSFRTLIIGTNEEAQRIAELMLADRWGYTPIGFVSPGSGEAAAGKRVPRVLGGIDRLRDLVTEHGADCLFVAASDVGVRTMGFLSELSRVHNLELRVTSNLPEVLSSRLAVQPIGGMMALSLKPATLTRPQAFAKRVFDLLISSVLLVLTSPIWLVAAVAVRLTSRGPVLFRQTRIGMHGRSFKLFKFRTMVANAEALRDSLAG